MNAPNASSSKSNFSFRFQCNEIRPVDRVGIATKTGMNCCQAQLQKPVKGASALKWKSFIGLKFKSNFNFGFFIIKMSLVVKATSSYAIALQCNFNAISPLNRWLKGMSMRMDKAWGKKRLHNRTTKCDKMTRCLLLSPYSSDNVVWHCIQVIWNRTISKLNES